MRKVELLPSRDCEAGYGPDIMPILYSFLKIIVNFKVKLFSA